MKKFRTFGQKFIVSSGSSDHYSKLPEEQLAGKIAKFENFSSVFWGWVFLFLPLSLGRLSQRFLNKTFGGRENEKKLEIEPHISELLADNFVGVVKMAM